MNALWLALSVLTPLGLIMFIGNHLLKQSLTQEGLCPVCSGEGGPCESCNGLGVIVKPTQVSPPPHH